MEWAGERSSWNLGFTLYRMRIQSLVLENGRNSGGPGPEMEMISGRHRGPLRLSEEGCPRRRAES